MTPAILLIAGVLAVVAGIVVLRTFGSGYRVGRLLSATRPATVAEAIAVAGGPPRYVRIAGRIDADDEFEDDAHRPLVLRRTRLQIRDGRAWRTIDDRREAVAFRIQEGLDAIAIDADALDDGLVVVPRESVGTAADVADRMPAGTDPSTPVRLRVDQVSSVEQAVAAGVPTRGADGRVRLAAGLGRPLIVSTLEPNEAMRVLSGGSRGRSLAAAACLTGGAILITGALVWATAGVVT